MSGATDAVAVVAARVACERRARGMRDDAMLLLNAPCSHPSREGTSLELGECTRLKEG